MAMRSRFSLVAALQLALLQQFGACSQGDVCYITGAKTALLDNKLYFMGGNYSIVSFSSGQDIRPAASLYALDLDAQFPVERTIPASSLTEIAIDTKAEVAHSSALRPNNGDPNGAVWQMDDTLYFFGSGSNKPTNIISKYNITSGNWKDMTVAGGDFNFGNRTSAQSVSVPGAKLGFLFGGFSPYMGGMIRFDASDPANLNWTNETLKSGSHGTPVPNLNSAGFVYLPVGKAGVLLAFGGANVSAGINPDWGWPYDANWSLVSVYDIASHTWWTQPASGLPPLHRSSFGTAVTASPDGSAFHVTVYGGWSLNNGRSAEEVHVLSVPSFTWIDATAVSKASNAEQQVNGTIGRDSLPGATQTFRGHQMVVLGGRIRAGAYLLSDGECNNVFSPVRVLDLSTYTWQSQLAMGSSYQVPKVIYEVIGGDAKGGATATVPSAGWADETLAAVMKERPPSESGPGTGSPNAPTQSSGPNAGAIAGGVVGGVAVLAIIGAAWWLLVRSRQHGKGDPPNYDYKYGPAGMSEADGDHQISELHGNHQPAEAPGPEPHRPPVELPLN